MLDHPVAARCESRWVQVNTRDDPPTENLELVGHETAARAVGTRKIGNRRTESLAMISWGWLTVTGAAMLLVPCGAYWLYALAGAHRHHAARADGVYCGPGNELPAADTSSVADSHSGSHRLKAKQPSSTYEGDVCFFDSVEHRDMFEANHHRPVEPDAIKTPASKPRNSRQGSFESNACITVEGSHGIAIPSDTKV